MFVKFEIKGSYYRKPLKHNKHYQPHVFVRKCLCSSRPNVKTKMLIYLKFEACRIKRTFFNVSKHFLQEVGLTFVNNPLPPPRPTNQNKIQSLDGHRKLSKLLNDLLLRVL